jgi:hypothetical protein
MENEKPRLSACAKDARAGKVKNRKDTGDLVTLLSS